jgi:TRAP-type C4-dicarboxylate transport system permease small subunit
MRYSKMLAPFKKRKRLALKYIEDRPVFKFFFDYAIHPLWDFVWFVLCSPVTFVLMFFYFLGRIFSRSENDEKPLTRKQFGLIALFFLFSR